MALNINGTTGISGDDGSASAPALQGTDGNTGINFGSDTVNINTGGTTRATIDSSGALDVPTNFPIKVNGSEKLKIDTSGNLTFSLEDSSNYPTQQIKWSNDSTTTNGFYIAQHSDRHGRIWHEQGLEIDFGTSNTQRMRIDSSGKVQIGTTSAIQGSILSLVSGSGVRVAALESGGTSANDAILFRNANGDVGRIVTDGSSTSYNTSSDYRLKENVVAISDGITRLKTLKPKRFNFIANAKTTVDGFLAHEVTAVPEAIAGTKDEVDENNEPVYQGIDQSKLVPLLTAALQEAIAKIEVLETKVAALEAA